MASKLKDISKLKDVSKLRLVLVEGDDYAKSAGEFSLTDDKVRNKNIWVCQSNSRMTFYTGSSWVITATQDMQDVLDGSTGGYESSKCVIVLLLNIIVTRGPPRTSLVVF